LAHSRDTTAHGQSGFAAAIAHDEGGLMWTGVSSTTAEKGGSVMGGKSDEAKGRVKEAAGVLTGDKKLERKGKGDQVGGKLKQAVEKVKKKTDEVIDDVKDALS
jgi:uncharacterized protein YjbJ (UPF0337 family)